MTPFPTSDQSKSPPAVTDSRNRKHATLVLGTHVEQDARQRMERAIALAKRYPDNIIVALGTHVDSISSREHRRPSNESSAPTIL
ncbi:hypothetical protein E6H36_07325 [Candidatus Bathyarchaeota archaeon]|nr:MAG: hypothetical protein E6H36_07325 [Candidatus Bathyarchaeota archaeon]